MIKGIIENRFSKNMATINYWLREQNFYRYSGLCWETAEGKTTLYFPPSLKVAEVSWFTVLKNNQEYCVPMFDFKGEYEFFNGNQLSFWILRNIEKEIAEPTRFDHAPECRCKQCKLDKGIDDNLYHPGHFRGR